MNRIRRRPGAAVLDRREALTLLGAGAALVAGCASPGEGPPCVPAPALTAGPYWMETGLDRADLRWDSHHLASPDPRPGVPLALELRLLAVSAEGCVPLRGARVDLWHCDAAGIYSDVPASGTGGQDFLRGYQVAGSDGRVAFLTIYPGWYAGRAVHVHARVRVFDAWSEVSTETTTQLFFDDAVTDLVHGTEPYASRGPRDTRNAADPVLGGRGALLLRMDGDLRAGFRGSLDLPVRAGDIRPG